MLDILPTGNALLASVQSGSNKSPRRHGLGLLSRLSDELVAFIFAFLDAQTLARCDSVSAWFSALARQERLWKEMLLVEKNGHLDDWNGNWRNTYIAVCTKTNRKASYQSDISKRKIFSDILYANRLCARFDPSTLSLHPNIDRIDARTLAGCAQLPDKPVILTHSINDWQAYSSQDKRWTLENLAKRLPTGKFRAEAILATMSVYHKYCRDCASEDNPTYLFDADFVTKAKLDNIDLEKEFKVPEVFNEDLFNVLGDERPEFRWIIAGPKNSGSTFHKDPNRTSAWNAVCSGKKLWLCLPSTATPPGVIVSSDEGEISTPDSVAEWLLHYYAVAKSQYGMNARDPKHRGLLLEGICNAGETFHIPSGWWHLVINLEESVAVTQNYIGARELPHVLNFMKQKPDQVSGFRLCADDDTREIQSGVYEKFSTALQKRHPELLVSALKEVARMEMSQSEPKSTLWTRIQQRPAEDKEEGSPGFSFGFDFGQ